MGNAGPTVDPAMERDGFSAFYLTDHIPVACGIRILV